MSEKRERDPGSRQSGGVAMAKAKRAKARTKSNKPNYVIIGKGGHILVVSGATGEITTLGKAQSGEVLELVRARQALGKRLAALLSRKGFALTDEVVIDLEV
jgi:hypothetical protein